MSDRILLIDADEAQRDAQLIALSAEGHDATAVGDARQALTMIQASSPDIIFCDICVPGAKSADLVRELAQCAPEATILVTFAHEDRELAIEATGRGAHDILEKPLQPEELRLRVRNAHERTRRIRENRVLNWEVSRTLGNNPIVAASGSMIELLEKLERAASHKKAVLMTGEAGTGKEILARAIHAQSVRRSQNFVAVSCAVEPSSPFASPIFESSRHSAAGGNRSHRSQYLHADRGTLFLDQVGELPEALQDQLARLLGEDSLQPAVASKEGAADVRIIAASSHNLEEAVASGRFREDLYTRLCAVRLDVPPLRERRKDIPLLVDHFLEHYRLVLSKPVRGITEDALERLVAHDWPGNIRELENVCERAMILAKADRITTRDLSPDVNSPSPKADSREEDLSLKRGRRAVEIDLIRRALRSTNGNRTHAAKRLEISHRALLYKLKEYGIRD
jgi:two-component system response regulator AtoC